MTYPDDLINKVIQGDCLEVMKLMPDKCVDLVLTDPPYGVNLGHNKQNQKSLPSNRRYDVYEDTEANLDELISKFMPEVLRIAIRVVLTPGVKNMWKYPKPTHVGSFFYPAASGCNTWGFSCWQPIFYYGKDPYAGRSRPDSFKSTEQTVQNGHPCPKPVEQWRKLLDRVSLPEEVALDPFIGSGTTAVAAKQLGRKFIGIELSQKYVDIANARLAQDLLF
jgi:DNA modification methylase